MTKTAGFSALLVFAVGLEVLAAPPSTAKDRPIGSSDGADTQLHTATTDQPIGSSDGSNAIAPPGRSEDPIGRSLVASLAPPLPDVEISRNVRYGEDPYLNALDVYRPTRAGPHPVLIFIHGGGWSEGDKGNHPRKGTFFARAGFLYVTVNYRLSPAVKHPVHAQDVAQAVAWVHRNAGSYGGDPSRIYLMGHSAGAHLAALVTADARYLAQHGVPREAIAGVALLDGSGYDLEKRVPRSRGWMRHMLTTAFGEDPATWRDASPILHVDKAKRLPPFLILHVLDRKVSIVQAKELASALAAAGATAEVVAVPGRNHVTINKRLGLGTDPVARRILRFFSR